MLKKPRYDATSKDTHLEPVYINKKLRNGTSVSLGQADWIHTDLLIDRLDWKMGAFFNKC